MTLTLKLGQENKVSEYIAKQERRGYPRPETWEYAVHVLSSFLHSEGQEHDL